MHNICLCYVQIDKINIYLYPNYVDLLSYYINIYFILL